MATIPAGTNLGTATTLPTNVTRNGDIITDSDATTTIPAGTVMVPTAVLSVGQLSMTTSTSRIEFSEGATLHLTGLALRATGQDWDTGVTEGRDSSIIISGDGSIGTLGTNNTDFLTFSGDGTPANATEQMFFDWQDGYIDAGARFQALINLRRHTFDFTNTTIGERTVLYAPSGVPLVGTTFLSNLVRADRGAPSSVRWTSPVFGANGSFTLHWGITAEGWSNIETNLSADHTYWYANPTFPANLTASVRNTNSAAGTHQIITAWAPRVVNSVTQAEAEGDFTFNIAAGVRWAAAPSTYDSDTDVPMVTTGGTFTFNNSPVDDQDDPLPPTNILLLQASRTTVSNNDTTVSAPFSTGTTPRDYFIDTWGWRLYANNGARIGRMTEQSTLANTLLAFAARSNISVDPELFETDLDPDENTGIPQNPNAITEAVADAIISESDTRHARNTDEVYAVSNKFGRDNDFTFIPWEVDTVAVPVTADNAMPNTGRRYNASAPTTGSWYRLKPGITLSVVNGGSMGYQESNISYDNEGNVNPTGDPDRRPTVQVPVDVMTNLANSGRPIRLDGGRQVELGTGVTNDDINLDTSVIDDFENIPAAQGNSSIIYPTDTVDAGIAWRVSVGTTEIAAGVGQSASPTIVDYNTHNSIITTPVSIVYGTRDSLTNVRRTIAPARQIGQDVSVTVPLDGLQVAPRVPTQTQAGLSISIDTMSLTSNRVDVDAVGLVKGQIGSLNISGATAVAANATATEDYLVALDLLIRAQNLVDLTVEGTDTADFIIVSESGTEFIDPYVNMDDNGMTNATEIPGAVWVNPDRTSRGEEADLVPTNVTRVGGIPQVTGGVRFADRTALTVSEDGVQLNETGRTQVVTAVRRNA